MESSIQRLGAMGTAHIIDDNLQSYLKGFFTTRPGKHSLLQRLRCNPSQTADAEANWITDQLFQIPACNPLKCAH